ncbi:MAG: hypothetical protein IT416_04925 [Candidatus Pacebacteria bacterium]|jgi:hypothetical protein|nr:hypothetical protein [Candidatus Paceibacterota bacterium]
MNKKLTTAITILVISVFLILFLWQQTLILPIILLFLAYIKHKTIPIKKEFLWFTSLLITSWLVEVLLVNIGQAWQYNSPSFLNVPIYLPIFWGILGTTLIIVHQELTKKFN